MKLTIKDGRDHFYTFDSNRILLLTATDEEQIKQVEFSTEEAGGTETWTKDVLEQEDGVKYVQVPNEFLNGDYTRLVCYAVALDSKGEFTRQKEVFRIKYRPQPEDWFLTYSERVTFASIKALTEIYKASAFESMNAAKTSETNAKNSADLARRYAEEAEDVEVETGKYSSKHWNIKTQKKFDEVKEYVGSSSEPTSALGSIETARVKAINDIETKKDNSIAEIDTHVTEVAVSAIDEYVDKTANPEVLRYGKEQVDSYINGTSKPELDRYVNSDKKTVLDQYTENEKKKVLDQYTEEKKGELDSYTNTDKKKVLDDYVNNVKKVELNTYTNDKKSELDVYKTTKADELNEHTVSLKGSLDGYTTAKEQEISEFTEQKKQEVQGVYQNDLDELKGDLEVLGVTNSVINLSNYDVITGTMQSNGNWGSINSSSYKSALITDIPSKVRVKAQTNHNAYVSFFYKKPEQPTLSDLEVYFCDGEIGRHTITQNTAQTIDVPTDCKCIVVTVLNGELDYSPTMSGIFVEIDLAELNSYVYNNVLADETYSKRSASYSFNTINDTLTHVWTGYNYLDVKTQLVGALLIEIPCSGFAQINYPVFKTSQDLGSIFIDKNNIVIGGNENKSIDTGENATIDVPKNAVKFVLNISPSLSSFDWNVKLIRANVLDLFYEVNALSKNAQSVFEDENRNMCLAGIKTDILTNKIPYHRGYLFHKLQNNDNSLWYGTDFNHINMIGTVNYDPTLMRFAISPKDGRIIAVQRDTRNGIYVWDGETETHVTGFTLEPMAWLYNSGVDFINDGTDEYCIFAEYKGGAPFDSFNVWRGKYPYTSVSDWEIVLTQTPTDITHFHMIRRDPWSNILYLTSGDDSTKCKWWYSTDYGATWTLLTTGSTSGYEDHICRCINFVFTTDYVYWATDKGTNHCLNRASRDSNGILDVASRYKLCDLQPSCATNSICYVESPHGIFLYDRIDIGYTADYGNPVSMQFWDIDKAELTTIATLPLITSNWGGSRGKCYVNYTNGKQTMPAMGFSIDTPCIFDLVCDNPSNIGTIAYDVGSKTIHTIEY